MDKNKITLNQYMFIVFSCMLGVGILALASSLCKTAQQNGWIAIFIGGLYPLFILISAAFIDKKTNHASYWDYSKKIYGNILTKLFAIIFFLFFMTIFSSITSGYANVLKISIMTFLDRAYIILPCLILIAFISLAGIQMVGRACEFYFYVTLPLLVLTFFLIPSGSITNIQPIYFSFSDIAKSTPNTFYAFSGCEISFFIIHKIITTPKNNKMNTKKAGIFAALFVIFIYFSNVFIVILNLGWEVASTLEYPLLYLIQTIEIPIISNFLSIVIFLWSVVILRSLLVYNHITSDIASNITKIDYKKLHVPIFILVNIYVFFMIPEFNRKTIVDLTLPYFVGFSFLWTLITTIMVSKKYRGNKI